MFRDSSIGIVTGYALESRCSIPGRGKIFLFSIASRLTLRPTKPSVQWVWEALTPGVERPGREADHSRPSSAEFRNGAVIPPLPICFHVKMFN
jgi:hypothetical protein